MTTPSPQTQQTTSPLTQSSFHPSSPSQNNLRILQWNANGIRPRCTELLHFLSHNQYDLIFIQESHLSSDSTFRIPGYKTLQKNRFMTRRGTTNSTGNLGGGVLILVKNGLSYTSLSTQSLSSLDPSSDYLAIAVKIKGAAPIHLFNVYVPPIRSSSSDSRPKSFSPFLLPSSPTTYIFGDFNSHHSSWDSHLPEDHSGKDLFDWLLSSDLLPLNNPEHHTLLHRATGNRSSPDLSLVPARLASKCTWQTLPDLGSDHLPISITIPTSPIINSFHRPPSFNYNKARWDEYLTYIDTHCPIPSNFTTLSLSEATHTFTKLLNDAATSAIPFGSINRPAKAWWSPEVADAVAKRRKAFAKAHCSEEDRQHYIATSRYTSTVINKAKAKSWQNTCSSLSPKTRPSEVFSLLRSISGSPSPTTSDLPNFSNCHTPVDCANHLSSHLQSHFSTQTPKPFRSTEKAQMKQIRTAHCNTLHSTFCTPFSSIELSTAISQLSTSTSLGPDQITYPLLSHLPQSALHFLLYIFNLSWSTHTFPSAWKQSTIIPILKPGKPSDSPSSYRPISLTSCTSKLFERMVLGRLTYFLEQHDILSPVQAGFRPGRSTVDQVLLLSQSIADSFHQSKPGARTVLATVDFAKAFDSVWHSALLSKLLSLDLPLCFVEWIRSYLSDRRSKVRICNSYSRPFRLRRGVPQGSVLRPVLFSLYINDLPTFLPASVKTSLYADDLAIWASSPKVECATAVVQAALNRLVEWSSKWRLPLNPLKCETSFFSLDPYQSRIQPSLHILNTPLKFNPHPTFLGVTFDRTLSFRYHVLSLRKKFHNRFRAFRSIASASWGPSKESLCTLYKAFIRPILTYASPGWFLFSSPTHITSVERMHRSSCRVITGCLSSTPIPLLHIEALLPPLRVTLTHQSLSFFERALRLPPTFPIACLANSNPRTRLKKCSWRSFSRSHNLTPNLHLTREPLILCPPNPLVYPI